MWDEGNANQKRRYYFILIMMAIILKMENKYRRGYKETGSLSNVPKKSYQKTGLPYDLLIPRLGIPPKNCK